jgi:hypothetical protein
VEYPDDLIRTHGLSSGELNNADLQFAHAGAAGNRLSRLYDGCSRLRAANTHTSRTDNRPHLSAPQSIPARAERVIECKGQIRCRAGHQWIAILQLEYDGKEDDGEHKDEITWRCDELNRLGGAILSAEPVTEEVWTAIAAMLIDADDDSCVALCNVEAVEKLKTRLIIDRVCDPAIRERWLQALQLPTT